MCPNPRDESQTLIDISYLGRALGDIDQLVHQADLEPDPVQRLELEVLAGKRSCETLKRLADHQQLWEVLREQYQLRARSWDNLSVPVVAELLEALGYAPPGDGAKLEDLIILGNRVLREAAGLPPTADDPIVDAQTVIRELQIGICNLKGNAANRLRRRKRILATRKILLGVLLASVVNPQIQQGLRDLGPHLLELIETLAEHAHLALTGLSAGMVVLPKEAVSLLRQPDPAVVAPDPSTDLVADLSTQKPEHQPSTGTASGLDDSPRGTGPLARQARAGAQRPETQEPGLHGPTQDPKPPTRRWSPGEQSQGPATTPSILGRTYIAEGQAIDVTMVGDIANRLRRVTPPEEQHLIDELDRLAELARQDNIARSQRIDPHGGQAPEGPGRL